MKNGAVLYALHYTYKNTSPGKQYFPPIIYYFLLIIKPRNHKRSVSFCSVSQRSRLPNLMLICQLNEQLLSLQIPFCVTSTIEGSCFGKLMQKHQICQKGDLDELRRVQQQLQFTPKKRVCRDYALSWNCPEVLQNFIQHLCKS